MEKELRLQPRLQCIAGCVPRGTRLADVGTDHGYLPVWLLQNDRIESAIASDINKGPLDHARRTADKYGVTERLQFRLCPGLDAVAREEADVVVIAGMGAEMIIEILRAANWDWNGVTLLLQPMTKAELLRCWLAENGFCMEREHLVRDKGTIYAVLEVHSGQSVPLTAAESWCGPGAPDEALYGEYALDRACKLEYAAAGMRKGKNRDETLIASMEADAAALRRKVKEWENADRAGH